MFRLVTRFHLLLLAVLMATTGVILFRVPDDFSYPAHWGPHSQPDWIWPRDMALAGAPIVALLITLIFIGLGMGLTKNRLLQTRHVLDPALTLFLTVADAVQMGLLLIGIGSDLDLIKLTAYGLGALLIVVGVVIAEAERNSYAGLRLPWPIKDDRAWRVVHRAAGFAFALAGAGLVTLAWVNADLSILIFALALAQLGPVAVAAVATALMRQR
ncbi:SdpI family protein [Devosia rhodophyticola]|uniref:SdpI family protein n=1 Tax=Devosia rhodophyticola TaxID=3026423 RepID=A0ABY7YY72_9HYPH|nr:SdpI family protein [Devosia rhodophyticola]WDR06043.1 SdpI family protein [Devosia rhodophyticola]